MPISLQEPNDTRYNDNRNWISMFRCRGGREAVATAEAEINDRSIERFIVADV